MVLGGWSTLVIWAFKQYQGPSNSCFPTVLQEGHKEELREAQAQQMRHAEYASRLEKVLICAFDILNVMLGS